MGDFTKSSLAFHVCKIMEDDKFCLCNFEIGFLLSKVMGSKYANCDFLLRICVGKDKNPFRNDSSISKTKR
jgi:hypothetical protein